MSFVLWLSILVWFVKGDKNATVSDGKKFRVCILCEPNPVTYVSGQASRFRLMMQHFSDHCRETHKLSLVTADAAYPSPPSTCFDGNIPIHYTLGYPLPSYPKVILPVDATLKTLRVLFPWKERKFDIIHVSSPGFFLFIAVVASQIYQIPLLVSYHTHLPVYARSYLPYPINVVAELLLWKTILILHRFADLTLVTSPQMAEEFLEHYRGARFLPDTIPIRVWRKGVDMQRFHPNHRNEEMRKRMAAGGSPNDFLLVYVGRLGKEKRLKDLRGILEEMNRRHAEDNKLRNTRLCLVGEGPQEDELKEHFAGTPTVFLGRLDGIELSQAFASGDAFGMPSDSETLGFVVLETMASGVPCVAAAAGGPLDLIDNNTTGYLVPTGNIHAFCDRLEALQRDPILHQKVSLLGRQEAERWNWYSSMDELRTQAYPECLENFQSRASQRMMRWLSRGRAPKRQHPRKANSHK